MNVLTFLVSIGVVVAPPVPAVTVVQTARGPLASFVDADGRHEVRFVWSTPPPGKGEEPGQSKRLDVVHTQWAAAGKPGAADNGVVVWQAKDFVLDCVFDLTFTLIDESIAVTDLDGDGHVEFWFAYFQSCRSDVSPDDMKLLMFEGKTKYALRGTRETNVGAVDEAGKPVPMGGAYDVDAAFTGAPAAFLKHATATWSALQPTFR